MTPAETPLIVWLNGPFGVGKTTTAELVAERTGWRLFDPEHVGYLLAGNLRDLGHDDFQDLPPWRSLVPTVAREILRFTEEPALVAVQTVLVEDYWRELATNLEAVGLRTIHVLLDCQPAELRRRIRADEEERAAEGWRLDHVGPFEGARGWLRASADIVIDSTTLGPTSTAERVVDRVEAAVGPGTG